MARAWGLVMADLHHVWRSWLFTMVLLTKSEFFILTAVVQPIVFATIAFFLFSVGGDAAGEQTLLFAALGTGMMGVWSTTLFGGGGAIAWQRWERTLELLVSAPRRYDLTLLGQTMATASVGFYSMVATLLWGVLLFGMPLSANFPIMLPLALLAAVVGMGVMAMLLATTFVLYRHANALSNLLEYPIWIATGMIVPLAVLPGWLGPISWVLVPTWGIAAIRDAAMGSDPPWLAIGMCFVLSVAYYLIARRMLVYVIDKARRDATLNLA